MNDAISISKLPEQMDLYDTDYLSVVDTANMLTGKITIQTLRDLLNYKGAFASISDGVAKTKNNQIFYVYKPEENGDVFKVSPFLRYGVGAVELKDEHGNEIFFYISDKIIKLLIDRVKVLYDQQFKGETVGDFGKSRALTEWKGERGQFDVWPTLSQPLNGAGTSFGGKDYRAFLMVNGNGGIVTQLRDKNKPITRITHTPYVADSGRSGPDGQMTRILKIPANGKTDVNNEYEMEFSTGTGYKPVVKIRHPLIFTGAPGWDSRSITLVDEASFKIDNSIYYQKVPTEASSGTIVPGVDYRVKMARAAEGTTLHIYIRTAQGNFICSLVNSGMNVYISFKVKGDTKYGLYKIFQKAKYYLSGDGANYTHLMVADYKTDPDGNPADLAKTPGVLSADPACGFDSITIIGLPKNVTMVTGTALTDPFNNTTFNLNDAFTLTRAVKDSIKAPNQYIDKTVVTGVNFDAKTTTTEVVKVGNPGFVFDLTYNRNFRYGEGTTTGTSIMNMIVPYEAWDIVHLNFMNPEKMRYGKDD